MLYFKDLSDILYRFGDEEFSVSFQNIATYVDVLDQVKDNSSFYQFAYVQEGMRPDQLSIMLYDTPIYYWTFFLMNDNLRLQGWPLTNRQLEEKMKHDYDHTVVTVRKSFDVFDQFGERIDSQFIPGRIVTSPGVLGSASGIVAHRNLDLGQIFIEKTNDESFLPGQTITAVVDGRANDTAPIISVAEEYNAVHHYEDVDGRTVDIDPLLPPPAQYIPITYYQRAENQNEELRTIKVLTPSIIDTVISSFKQAVRTSV